MSSKFLTFMFIILVSVQLSCGWSLWKNDKQEESSTEKTTEKSFKDDEPNSSPRPPLDLDYSAGPLPKDPNVLSSDNNEDAFTSGSSVQPTIMTPKNVAKTSTQAYSDEDSEDKYFIVVNSGKGNKSIPTTSTNSTDPIVKYLSSNTTQITDSSTPTTEKSESESSTTANTTTSTTTENTLNDNDDVNNVVRNVDEDKDDSKGSSSVSVSPSTIPSLLEHSNFAIESINNSSESTLPEVTYAANEKDLDSGFHDGEEPKSDDQPIGRKDKETHSPRNVTDEPDYSTQKTTTENYESGNSSTTITNTPTENMLNSTSNNEVRNVFDGTENSDNSSKSETVSDLDPSASMQANTTIETILSTSTATMYTTEMAGSMSNGTTPEVNFGSFVNSGSTGNTYSPLILNLCILIFSISVIV